MNINIIYAELLKVKYTTYADHTGIVGSNRIWGMDVCVRLFCVCVVLCIGKGLATGWSPVQGILPTV
jgi:hypothetical protein